MEDFYGMNHHKPSEAEKGRGAAGNPKNRFQLQEYAVEWPEAVDEWEQARTDTRLFEEEGRSILNKVDSPDVPGLWSLNPYQGCEHGCIYCYARPTHEYWGFSAGKDFESRIVVKRRAPELLEHIFSGRRWKPAVISLSGNTDCYQPIERRLQITRRILEVCRKFRNPVSIITKNALVLRDLDILQDMAADRLVMVYLSVGSVDEELRRKLEPRTSTYAERLLTLQVLGEAGIPTGVMCAPVIPGLNDAHMYEVLRQASHAGVKQAGYTMVRLNGPVAPLFQEWLQIHYPERAAKVWNAIAECHSGSVSDHRFGTRMRGEGPLADMVSRQFAVFTRQFGLNREKITLNTEAFIRQQPGQLRLF